VDQMAGSLQFPELIKLAVFCATATDGVAIRVSANNSEARKRSDRSLGMHRIADRRQ